MSVKITQKVTYRIDHAPADNPNTLVEQCLNVLTQKHPSIKIDNFKIRIATPYMTRLHLSISYDQDETFLPNKCKLDLGDGYWADISMVFPV